MRGRAWGLWPWVSGFGACCLWPWVIGYGADQRANKEAESERTMGRERD